MHKLSIFYSWFIRTITYFLPNFPVIMRFRGFLYSLMMKECSYNFQVHSSVHINSLWGLKVRESVYIGPNTVIIAVDVEIGNHVLIGPNCLISGGNHQFDGYSFRNLPSKSLGPIIIEEGSWVAGDCTILSGSKLPKYSILAAGAVLNEVFNEELSIIGGIPAKKIGQVKR
jgi:acetyltransferase-like isoleucine patch superfamily enzyme